MIGWYVSGRLHKKLLTVVASSEGSWRVRDGVRETAFFFFFVVLNIAPSVCVTNLKERQRNEGREGREGGREGILRGGKVRACPT